MAGVSDTVGAAEIRNVHPRQAARTGATACVLSDQPADVPLYGSSSS